MYIIPVYEVKEVNKQFLVIDINNPSVILSTHTSYDNANYSVVKLQKEYQKKVDDIAEKSLKRWAELQKKFNNQ